MPRPTAGRATRVAATGMATATCLGLVAAMGSSAADELVLESSADPVAVPVDPAPAPAPTDVPSSVEPPPVARRVVVVVRRHRAAAPHTVPAAVRSSTPVVAPAPARGLAPPPAPPPAPAPPPQARSGGS